MASDLVRLAAWIVMCVHVRRRPLLSPRPLALPAAGLFFIGYLAQVPANMVCMALGPRKWLPCILAAWGAVAMCFAAVGGTAGFLTLRLLLGVAEAGA